LTHICSRWRNISLSFPSLWNTIILNPHNIPSAPMLNAQLFRSGNAPLSIIIQYHRWRPPHDILVALLGSSSRWENLTLPSRSSFCDSFSGQFPLLHKIDITRDHGHITMPPMLLIAPALRHISLGNYPSPLIFPWTQITRYHASGTWNNHLDALPRMVNLVECHLRVESTIGTSFGPPIRHKNVTVPTLQKLYFCGGFLSDRTDNLVVPALEDLFVHGDVRLGFPWFERSQCQLRRLAITDSLFVTDIHKNFQQFPTITDVTFTAFSTHPIDVLNMLPNLERIAIYSGRCFGLNEFRDLIQSRRTAASHTLQVLSFGVPPPFVLDPNMKATMKHLEEEGLQVRIEVMQLNEWYSSHGWEQATW